MKFEFCCGKEKVGQDLQMMVNLYILKNYFTILYFEKDILTLPNYVGHEVKKVNENTHSKCSVKCNFTLDRYIS